MSFTITRSLDQLPSYPMLCELAANNRVHVTGDERNGSFSCRGVEGDYEFGDGGVQGKFTGHGVRGEFCFEIGKATLTVTDKPFWLPEVLLKQQILKGLDRLCTGVALRMSS